MRNNDHTVHTRENFNEILLAHKLNQLTVFVSEFAHRVSSNLPAVGSISNLPPVSGPFYQMGQPSNLDDAMLNGHGPRFVAKYNLATSDAERRRLLDTLPDIDRAEDGIDLPYFNLEELTAEYRQLNDFSDSVSSLEFLEFFKRFNDDTPLYDCPTVLNISELFDLPYHPEEHTVEVPAKKMLLRYQPPQQRVEGHGWNAPATFVTPPERLFAVIGMPEISAYVFIEHVMRNYGNRSSRIIPRIASVFWWNQHELCWNQTSDMLGTARRRLASDRYTDLVGMPKVDIPTKTEISDVYGRFFDYVKSREDWLESVPERQSDYKKTWMSVVLPGQLALRYERGDYYNRFSVRFALIGGADESGVMKSIANNYVSDEHFNYISTKEDITLDGARPRWVKGSHETLINTSPHNLRRQLEAIEAFIAADESELTFFRSEVNEVSDISSDDD